MINRIWRDITSTIDLLIDLKNLSISQWDVEPSECSHFGVEPRQQR
ncbi:hypothetical protein AADZ84_04205 [Colwelliaceae bacterium MEBiC 14330]